MSDQQESVPERKGWFDKKENGKKVLYGLYLVCGLLVLLDVIFHFIPEYKKPYYNWEKWPAFYAVFGFVACVVLVLVARYILRPLVKRSEDYYEPKVKKGKDDV